MTQPHQQQQPSTRPFFCERLNPHFGYFYTLTNTLISHHSDYQHIEVFDSEEFGRVLALDGITQVVEKNEQLYHEPMVHPALIAHHNPQDICIIGGGDGGILREVLKHNPQRAVQCELDAAVIETSKKYLPTLSDGAFDDPRCQLEIGDGRAYIQSQQSVFDVVIMDMTDPFGPSTMLYTQEFFHDIKRSLRDSHGSFVMHSESPIARPIAYQQIIHTLSTVYAHQRILYIYVHMYATLWSIVISSDSANSLDCSHADISDRLHARGISGLQVYSADSHHSMGVEYPFISDIRARASSLPIITDTHHTFHDEAAFIESETPLYLSCTDHHAATAPTTETT